MPSEGQALFLSQLETWTGGLGDRATYWRLRLTERDAIMMGREQLEMIEDGLWLIVQALKGRDDGPLTTPHGLPVRIDQGGDPEPETATRRCPLCSRTVHHAPPGTICIGDFGWHHNQPREMKIIDERS